MEFTLLHPDFSYFYGFALTDGHLRETSRQRGVLSIEISVRDVDIINQFIQLFPQAKFSNRTRETNFGRLHAVSFRLFDLNFRNKLKSYGFPVGKKSEIATVPLGQFSEKDFWRGVLDGDGSLGFTKQGFPFISFTTKSENLAVNYKQLVKKVTGLIMTSARNKRDKVYNLMLTKEGAVQMTIFLYDHANLSVQRKREAAQKIKEWTRPTTMKQVVSKKWTIQEVEFIKTHSVTESMLVLKRSHFSILNKLQKTIGA